MSKEMQWCDRALLISPYHIGLCTTAKAFARELKRLKIPEDRRPEFMATIHAHGTTHYFEKNEIPMRYSAIVCISPEISKHQTLEQIHALLVHEAVHIWQSVRECLGEQHPSREFEAYSVQSIAQVLMVAWREAHKRSSRRRG